MVAPGPAQVSGRLHAQALAQGVSFRVPRRTVNARTRQKAITRSGWIPGALRAWREGVRRPLTPRRVRSTPAASRAPARRPHRGVSPHGSQRHTRRQNTRAERSDPAAPPPGNPSPWYGPRPWGPRSALPAGGGRHRPACPRPGSDTALADVETSGLGAPDAGAVPAFRPAIPRRRSDRPAGALSERSDRLIPTPWSGDHATRPTGPRPERSGSSRSPSSRSGPASRRPACATSAPAAGGHCRGPARAGPARPRTGGHSRTT